MIRIRAWRTPSGHVCRLSFNGHADAADAGHDVICAAVSVLAQTLMGGLVDQLNADLRVAARDPKAGHLDYSWTPIEAQKPLVEAILAALRLIAQQEPFFVSYSEVS